MRTISSFLPLIVFATSFLSSGEHSLGERLTAQPEASAFSAEAFTAQLRQQVETGSLIPLSFRVGGKPAVLSLRSFERRTVTESWLEDGWTETRVFYRVNGVPLDVALLCRIDPERKMIRLAIRLEAREDIRAPLDELRILDLAHPLSESVEEMRLNGLYGGAFDWAMPTRSFRPWEKSLKRGERIVLDSGGSGRSSNIQMPLWILSHLNGGFWFGPEWSGCWRLDVGLEQEKLRIRLGLPTFHFIMNKGESLTLPTVALGVYRGGNSEGQNHLRNVIYEDYLPPVSGRKPVPQVYWQGYGGHPGYHTEKILYEEVDAAARVGCEAFILDGGWNNGPDNLDWFASVGRWKDESRFPGGLRNFGRYVKSKDMRFGVWMEPRAHPDSELFQENKDLFLPDDRGAGLMNLARPEAVDLLVSVVEGLMRDFGVDWIWLDFNVDPRELYWDRLEPEDRKGLMELGFYQGWYQAVERLLRKHQDLWLESCASGGRLVDLGQLRHSHSIWVTDPPRSYVDDEMNRSIKDGLNRFLPAVYIMNSIFINGAVIENEPQNPELKHDFRFLSYFGGSFGFGQGLSFWNAGDLEAAARYVNLYKEHRRYLEEEFYHLLPLPVSRQAWDGWQYHDARTQSGIVLVFRLKGSMESLKIVPLRALKQGIAHYEFRIVAGEGSISEREDDIVVQLPVPGGILLHYKRR